MSRPANALQAAVILGAAVFASAPVQRAPLQELATRALARIDGEITVSGLRGEAQVVRDTWGMRTGCRSSSR